MSEADQFNRAEGYRETLREIEMALGLWRPEGNEFGFANIPKWIKDNKEKTMSEKFLTEQDVAAIRRHYKETVPVNQRLTDRELDTALIVAEKRQLYPPPLGNHIYFMKRKNRELLDDGSWGDVYVMSLQTGIDGFRLIAERSGKYVGSGVPEYENDPQGFVKRAIIHVEKVAPDGGRAKIGADAWFEEYAQYTFKKGGEKSLTKMWAEKSRLMLSKVAEALALRKAFPELSGLYTTDEMGAQDDGTPETPVGPPPSPPQARPPAAAQPSGSPASSTTPSRPTSPPSVSTASPTPSAPAAAPTAASSATTPTTATAAGADALADVEKKKKLANAMALFCSTFKVSRADMVRTVRSWSPRPDGQPQVIGDAGNLNAELLATEYAKIIANFKAWEAQKRASQNADAEAEKWERENAQTAGAPAGGPVIADDDIPF